MWQGGVSDVWLRGVSDVQPGGVCDVWLGGVSDDIVLPGGVHGGGVCPGGIHDVLLGDYLWPGGVTIICGSVVYLTIMYG